ncbi:MAG: citrate lyase subunit alpha, partial [Acholeplasmataceae bacterium]|nr:citrate lyase subunit alpha [Acholeplasmataceae bacterium]
MFDTKLMAEINKIPGYEQKKIFAGAFATQPSGSMAARPLKCVKPGTKKVYGLEYILDAVGLKDGMTISFHHCLRNGDAVMQYIVAAIAKKGI